MAPEVALAALAELPAGSVVLDPMAGSGTVLRAAMDGGLTAIGFDVDPLAVLIAGVWTSPLSPSRLRREALAVVERAEVNLSAPNALPWIDNDAATKAFIDFWFGPVQQQALRSLVSALPEGNEPLTSALRLAVSRTIITKDRGASLARDVSHSRPHKVRHENEFDVLKAFGAAAARIARALEDRAPSAGASVRLGDARNLKTISDGSISAVVSSPPYLNAIDYMRGHKLALVWLGYTVGHLSSIRSGSIGSERAPAREMATRAAELLQLGPALTGLPIRLQRMFSRYLTDLEMVLAEMARVLAPAGRAVLVIGNSNQRGVLIDNAEAVTTLSRLAGLKLVSRYERDLPVSSRYLPTSRDTPLEKRMHKELVLSFVHD